MNWAWLVLCALAWPSVSAAQEWPARPIRVIVPVSAGSAIDLVARAVFDQLVLQLGQPLIIEYRLGAGGAVGAASAAKAEPDGYTILAHSVAIAVSPSTVLNAGYDAARDFAAVAPMANVPLVLAAQTRYKSVADLVAAGKARPGSLNYASVGYGATAHLVAERFRLAAGIEAQHIPFKGSPEGLTEIMAGRIDFTFSPIGIAAPLIQAGKISALAVTTKSRARALPDVPHHHRGRLPRFRIRLLDRPVHARKDAARHRREARPRDREGGAVARRAGPPRDAGRRAHGDDPRRVRRLSARADRLERRTDPADRHQAGVSGGGET
jgi:tripartite-type tricarboxylate transporter receptor subunit TctC